MGVRHPVFISCLGLYVALRSATEFGFRLPLFHGHLTDLLCMPVVLTVAQSTVSVFFPWFRITKMMAWATAGAFALWFEGVLPTIDPRHTADLVDAGCYAAGTALFLRLNGGSFPKQMIGARGQVTARTD